LPPMNYYMHLTIFCSIAKECAIKMQLVFSTSFPTISYMLQF
jgi:hypothetical protein